MPKNIVIFELYFILYTKFFLKFTFFKNCFEYNNMYLITLYTFEKVGSTGPMTFAQQA